MQIDEIIFNVCRNLSKSGSLVSDTDFLAHLGRSLSPQDAVELYCYFRDESHRFESEWRHEFIQFFPAAEPLLPAVDEADVWQDKVCEFVRANDLQGLTIFLRRIGTLSQEFEPKATYQECAAMGFRESLPSVPFDFYPIEGEDENCVTPIALARSLGRNEIASFLETAIAGLDAKYIAAYEQGRREA